MKRKINVLCFLDSDRGRDPEILIPLIYYIERFENCNVSYAVTWDIHEIFLKKPDVILIANTIGSANHFNISKYAYNSGIKVFALISEGNFRTNGTFNYWGYNTDKFYYQEKICLWSKRTYDFLTKEVPDEKEKMVLTGATGFDRYKIYKFNNKETFCKIHGIRYYDKIIGYAGWAFGKLFNDQGRNEIRFLHKDNPNRLKWMEEQMYLVEDILKETIINNPDILFILKRHPNEANQSITKKGMNEMMRLESFPNVLYFDKNVGINDILNVADIWTGFETTTTLEYWLLKKSASILINPDPDFKRDRLYQGSLICRNAKDFQIRIDEYYENGEIKDFYAEELVVIRSQLIRETIGFDDGLNHLRTGFYFSEMLKLGLDKNKKYIKFKFKLYIKHLILKIGYLVYNEQIFSKIPKVNKHVWIFKLNKFKNIIFLKNEYKKYLDAFYEKNNFEQKIKSGETWKDLGLN